mmetsp:Transcript_65350/g.175343  ORF Transcript_65350/g.175343 Transcript_65350/m.175343 type:complete len:269 (+) Transcript_65350:125-931(+)
MCTSSRTAAGMPRVAFLLVSWAMNSLALRMDSASGPRRRRRRRPPAAPSLSRRIAVAPVSSVMRLRFEPPRPITCFITSSSTSTTSSTPPVSSAWYMSNLPESLVRNSLAFWTDSAVGPRMRRRTILLPVSGSFQAWPFMNCAVAPVSSVMRCRLEPPRPTRKPTLRSSTSMVSSSPAAACPAAAAGTSRATCTSPSASLGEALGRIEASAASASSFALAALTASTVGPLTSKVAGSASPGLSVMKVPVSVATRRSFSQPRPRTKPSR